MAGVLCALAGSGGSNTIVVTVGNDSFSSKFVTIDQWGYANAANGVNGSAFGAVSPTTLSGATINGIYSSDTGSPGSLYLILNGDQTALSIASVLINAQSYSFGAASFSGGQTTWTAAMTGAGNQWGVAVGNPANAVFS